MSFTGGCLCGALRYRVGRRYLNAMHCYCGMCRRAHGTAFSTHFVVRPDQFAWTAGEDLRVVYASSADGRREFCPRCGSHVLVHGQSGDGNLAIPAGTLDGDPPLTLRGHMFVADCVGWYRIPDDGLPRFAAWPPGFGS